MKGRIIEVFSSIQGEGLWVGKPQVFVRFHGCKLKCAYCDTPLTHHQISEARIEFPPFSKKFEKRPLEFTPFELDWTITRFGLRSLALTGGEPLEQADFICEWLGTSRPPYEILLETNGVETEAAGKVLPFVGVVSLDLKIPSATGEPPLWKEHERFIETVCKVPHYAKVVYDERITDDEVEHLKMLAAKFGGLQFVFQPVSSLVKRDLSRCLEIFRIFSASIPARVRLIPQVHKFLSVL